jgi:hypothetical protein
MKKLHLHVDELTVEAFETTLEPVEDAGTVEANQTPTANSGGSCFDPTCRLALCRTDESCPATYCCVV